MHQVHRITLDDALPLLAAGRAKAEEIGVKQTLCVCDDGGNVLALHRLPGARLTGVDIAIAKAFTAAGPRAGDAPVQRATRRTRAARQRGIRDQPHAARASSPSSSADFPLVFDGQIVGGRRHQRRQRRAGQGRRRSDARRVRGADRGRRAAMTGDCAHCPGVVERRRFCPWSTVWPANLVRHQGIGV